MERPDFVAIDFEHSTPFRGSVCAVGIISFKNGKIIDIYSPKIKPPNNYYLESLSHIHKLTAKDTINEPSFSEVYPEIKKRLNGNTVVAHNAINVDKACLEQAMAFNHIEEKLDINWECTYQLTKVKLETLANVFELELNHHDASSDAKVCGLVFDMHLNKSINFQDENIQTKLHEENERLKELEHSSSNHFFFTNSESIAKPKEEHDTLKKYTFQDKLTLDLIKDKVFMVTGELVEERNVYFDFITKHGGNYKKAISGKVDFVILGEFYGHRKIQDIKKLNEKKGKNIKVILGKDFDAFFSKC